LPKEAAINGQWDVVELQDMYGVWLSRSSTKHGSKILQQPPTQEQLLPPSGYSLPTSVSNNVAGIDEVIEESEKHTNIMFPVVTDPE